VNAEKTIELARLLADLDGCEGGDLLRALCEVAEMATDGHGYSYAEGSQTQERILDAIRGEVVAHKAMIYGEQGDPSQFGYDDPDEAKRLIEAVEAE
jgi:hypothetical protein